ncbi:Uma2 family endonuclease [Spirosoma sp. KCTC 42546]|uniref:Uma2 family endonuclease n=1 Tax=Spirosoma sp. KCTC 42546 TaxID=2520506 RepID=UPI001156EC34|nr:Uma2 family endonuclease [Spirosoma sp. KCTC 42546]QDK80709.1 Uma2 family endonuclease [Spirosoma sp. KCTC 42546]
MATIVEVRNERYGIPKYAGIIMTKADFLGWESDDNYVYEFSNGVLEPTTGMRQEEMAIIQRITRRFAQTIAYQNDAELIPEIEVWVSEKQMRRPDLSFYTSEQIAASKKRDPVMPSFVAEIVSENDDARKYIKKLHGYFQAGVQNVWLVFPDDYTVYVYTSPKTVTICTDNDVLSAAPALPELQMTVTELFRR